MYHLNKYKMLYERNPPFYIKAQNQHRQGVCHSLKSTNDPLYFSEYPVVTAPRLYKQHHDNNTAKTKMTKMPIISLMPTSTLSIVLSNN